jgi:glycosyltransferase involved in cell wall biosynthesis
VHATNHPGIEGTRHIRRAVESLRAKGHAIDFVELRGVTHERVQAELADADLTIGKMKMGYYANFQVESLAAGVPAVTYVREDLITDDIRQSGLILAKLDTLEATIEELITRPDLLAEKRRRARASLASLHDNAAIAAQLKSIYEGLAPAGRRG